MTNKTTLKNLDDAILFMQTSGAGPMPKEPFGGFQWSMAGAHGIILISLKNIYVKASTIKPADVHDFLLYTLYWVAIIEHHHHIEEEWAMDDLKGAVSKETIIHEHDGFRHQIHDFQAYLESCLPAGTKWGPYTDVVAAGTTKREWDSKEAERLIEELVAAFLTHFCDEIGYLDAAKVRTTLSYEEAEAVNKKLEHYIVKQPPSFHVFSHIHRPGENFPPMPWFVKHILCPWVFYWPDRYMWRFAPKLKY